MARGTDKSALQDSEQPMQKYPTDATLHCSSAWQDMLPAAITHLRKKVIQLLMLRAYHTHIPKSRKRMYRLIGQHMKQALGNIYSKSLICRVFQHFDPASTLSSKLVRTSLTAEPLSCCSTTQFAGTANHVTVSAASQIYQCLATAELHATARRDQRRVVGFAGQLPSMAAHTKTPFSGSYHAYTLCRRASTPTHEHSSTISGDVKCSLAC
jgi:hypothetical protein